MWHSNTEEAVVGWLVVDFVSSQMLKLKNKTKQNKRNEMLFVADWTKNVLDIRALFTEELDVTWSCSCRPSTIQIFIS